ncbi:hypothetical protein TTHERM_01467270 (macronuclear) [Tetrahymena thermophila SB210]|uniref:Uncharacterized protein n=1 Tax=Tetrahymena thermophila (strain SB210) TaxID=312017 RepID=Q24F46_TETTS|nr:hypothetical protein TTHERM_01467270 [Tetrahymena thermophila SB210]EAS06396.2 hypothetical protein TTHERM_01467270 [Tetrahymena thermophila SB210]|eukprot:XP_001026641.2 hypothetical protein TTHERM_01467270 [Tetrahymena thermophila SB210]
MTDTLLPPVMYNKNSQGNNNQIIGQGNCGLNVQYNNQSMLSHVDSEVSKYNSSSESPMIKRKKLLKQLDQSFFIRLLQLEEQISKKYLTKEIINEIVNLYAKCVEYYDSIQDHIKIYFLEKIQITLSSIESLRVIYSSDENSAQKTQSKYQNQSDTPNYSQKKKKQNNIQKNKLTINKFQTESSLNTDQKSQQYSSYNEQSSDIQLKSNKNQIPNCASKSKIENVQVSDFFSPKPSQQTNGLLQNKTSQKIIADLIKSSSSKQRKLEKQNQNSLQKNEQLQDLKLNQFKQTDTSPSSLVALNQSSRKSIHSSRCSSLTKQSPSLIKNIQDFQSSFQNNQSSYMKESFLEEDSCLANRNRLRFTLNPNNFLQCDLNISDLNPDFSLTNTSHNSRIDINAGNEEKNSCNKSKLIEHGKALFNKNLERQFLNSIKFSQFENQNVIPKQTSQSEVQDLFFRPSPSIPSNNKPNQEERTILGVIKQNTNNNQETTKSQVKKPSQNLNQLLEDSSQRVRQKDKENQATLKQSKSLVNSNSKTNEKSGSTTLNSINEYSIQQKKIERAKRFSMFITMQNQKKQRVIKQDFNNILNRFEQDAIQKDQIVKSDIDNQMEILKKRLQDRKSKNIQDKVMKDIQQRQSSIKDLFENENYEKELRNGLHTTRF